MASGVIVGGVKIGGTSESVGAGEPVSWVWVGDGAGLAVRVGVGDAVRLGDGRWLVSRVGGGAGAVCVALSRGDVSVVDGSGAGGTAPGDPSGVNGDDATEVGGLSCGVPPSAQPTKPAATATGTPQIATHAHHGVSRRLRRCTPGSS